jgi:predicted DCC family thiol-disulfide oxidoreductase YuxK
MNPGQYSSVVFYDGKCGFCNGFVQWVLKHDTSKSVYFAPLQSTFAENKISAYGGTLDLTTVYFLNVDNKLYNRSKAIIKLLQVMWPKCSCLKCLDYIPTCISDLFYRGFSRIRYIFGKSEQCNIPTTEERERFIDA